MRVNNIAAIFEHSLNVWWEQHTDSKYEPTVYITAPDADNCKTIGNEVSMKEYVAHDLVFEDEDMISFVTDVWYHGNPKRAVTTLQKKNIVRIEVR